jgi:hypothetical protein
MHPRARRATSVAVSVALHALLLLWVATVSVTIPDPSAEKPLPVRIIEPRQVPAKPAAKPPPQVAKAPPAPPAAAKPELPPIEEPPKPPEPEPERKLPMPEQVVAPPDAGRNEVPPDTRFKSDRDVKVEKEQVKRGDPKPGESAPEAQAAAKPKPKPKPPAPKPPQPARKPPPRQQGKQVASLPSLDRLLPNAVTLAQEGYGMPPEPQPDAAERRAERRLAGGNDGLFIPTGPIGTLDYLPDVREGDITLLNTKAEVFAPFVRRVAVRVFQNFWISLKKDITNASLSAEEAIEAEVVMDPRGEMIGFTITKRSSRVTLASDRRLQQACNVGFFDRNPPPGARFEDGNIHFIFATQIQVAPSSRGSFYQVLMQAGLR